MNRQEIERTLVDLHALLAEDVDEEAFQIWFETNAAIFTTLGYVRALPHPRLEYHDGEVRLPDFLVKDTSGLWHVFELKRADTAVLKPQLRRQTFYAKFEEYLTQCVEYAEFFRDPGGPRLACTASDL